MSNRRWALYLALLAIWAAMVAAGLTLWGTSGTEGWRHFGNGLALVSLGVALLILFGLRALEAEQRLSYTILGADGVPATVTHSEIKRLTAESRGRFFERHPEVGDVYQAHERRRQLAVEEFLGRAWAVLITNSQARAETKRLGRPGDWIIWSLPWRTADHVASEKCERQHRSFRIVRPDGTATEYTAKDVDALSATQLGALFSVDPEMRAWWQGKPHNGPWNLFRFPGGHWISRDLLNRTSPEIRQELWHTRLQLLEWFLEGQLF